MSGTLDWAEQAARAFEPQSRRWPTPGAMALELDPLTRTTPALDRIDSELVELADSTSPVKLMVFCPPQEGKSEKVSRRFPLWLLHNNPKLRIVIVSYELDTAVRWGRVIKRDIEMNPWLGLNLRTDSHAAGRWETEQGGGIYCVGMAGAFTGRPADVLIIDDPVKDRAHAESKTIRDTCWDFWENVAKIRSHKVVLVQTRWHHDDLAGRLLVREPGDWRVVSIPAIAEEGDQLGREPGEELISVQSGEKRPPGFFAKLKSTLSNYVWLSLFQQRPTSAEGGIFPRGDWQYWTPGLDQRVNLDGHVWDLRDCTKFITIDLATSLRTSADFTVAAAWAIPPNGELVLLDRVRERVAESAHFDLVRPLRQRWLNPYDVTYVESRMFGTTLVYAAGKAGLPLAELKADTDKFSRALPAAGLVKQGRVWLPSGASWLDEWLDEHADFPNAVHDDQVDVLAYAARVAIAHFLPMMTAEQEDVYKDDGSQLNIMAIPY